MNSWEASARDATKALMLAHLRVVALILLAGCVLGATYCEGRSAGRSAERTAKHDAVRAAQFDTLKRLARDTADERRAVDSATTAVARADAVYRALTSRVTVVDDHTLTLDGIATTVPPLVVARIRADDALIAAEARKDTAQAAHLSTVSQIAAVEHHRAENDEAQIKDTKPSRFGLKTGLALGAGLFGLLVFLIK